MRSSAGGAGGDDDKGAATLTGVDVSEKLLERARVMPGQPYDVLRRADLNDPTALSKLGFSDHHFDVAMCVGVLTYIDPSNRPDLLRAMTRAVKPGGVVVFTCRTDLQAAWEKNVAALEAEGAWRCHSRAEMPYLPHNPDYADKIRVNVYAYVVL